MILGKIFSTIFDYIYLLFNQIFYTIANIRFFDIIDILIVTFIVYKAIEFLRETRAGQLIKGVVVLLIVFFLADTLNLVSLKWILDTIFDVALIAAIVIFQPELRRALERMGQANIKSIGRADSASLYEERINNCIDAVCQGVSVMSDKRIGALIVFERNTMLGDIANTGTVLSAEPSYEMLCNIFFPKSPLHDGALIVRDGYFHSAGCILPLTSNNTLGSQLGTRHRAAIGMSENSDAVVLVVSEETGIISVAVNGTIKRDFNPVTLKEELYNQLKLHTEDNENALISKIIKIFSKKK